MDHLCGTISLQSLSSAAFFPVYNLAAPYLFQNHLIAIYIFPHLFSDAAFALHFLIVPSIAKPITSLFDFLTFVMPAALPSLDGCIGYASAALFAGHQPFIFLPLCAVAVAVAVNKSHGIIFLSALPLSHPLSSLPAPRFYTRAMSFGCYPFASNPTLSGSSCTSLPYFFTLTSFPCTLFVIPHLIYCLFGHAANKALLKLI
jgi:hypothetical protein